MRLREADSMAAMAELRQKIAELEIQKEEGLIQGQLNHSDSRQYINQLRDQITELKNEIRILRGQKVTSGTRLSSGSGTTNFQDLTSPTSAEGDYLSSDEDLLPSPLPPSALYPSLSGQCHASAPLDSEGSTDSEAEERTQPNPQQLYGSMVCAEAMDGVN